MNLYNLDIERSVLATLIFESEANLALIEKLQASFFYKPLHQDIFKSIVTLNLQQKPIDETFILEQLQQLHEPQQHQALQELLLEILTFTPLANPDKYITELENYAHKRSLQSTMLQISQSLQENESLEAIELLLHNSSEKLRSSSVKELFSIHNALSCEAKEIEFITQGWLPFPKNTVSLISAPGGSGKSWLVLQLAIKFLQENPQKKAFLWLSEDPVGMSVSRIKKILDKVLNIKDSNLISNLLSRLDLSDDATIHVVEESHKSANLNPAFFQMKTALKDYDLIVLDPLIAFYGADENNNSHARKFMQTFTQWASNDEKTIVFIHHSTKNTTQSRGAGAFVDAVRLVYEVEKKRDSEGKEIKTNKRLVHLTKDNYGAHRYLGELSVERALFPSTQATTEISYEYKEEIISIDGHKFNTISNEDDLDIR